MVLGLGLDSSGVQPGIEDFDKLLDDATQQWNEKWEETTRDVDEHLLSNRESVRLFGEEFGVHLPRAVSSAVAKMLPDIASLGGALLGIYAAKELYDGVGKFTDWVRASFTEQTADAEEFAKAAAEAYEAAGKAAEGAFTKFKTVAAGSFDIAEIDAHAKHLEAIVRAYHELAERAGGDIRVLATQDAQAVQTIAQGAKEGITSVEQAEQKLAEAGALQFAARQRMAEVEKKTQAELTKQHEKDAREWVEGEREKASEAKRSAAEWDRMISQEYEYWKRRREERARAAKEEQEDQKKLAKAEGEEITLHQEEETWRTHAERAAEKQHEQLLKETSQRQLLTEAMLGNAEAAVQLAKEIEPHGGQMLEEILRRLREETKRLKQEWENAHPLAANISQDLRSMGIDAQGASVGMMECAAAAHQYARAAKEEVMAVQKDLIGSAEGLAENVAKQVGGEKALAAVKVISETAKGLECLAEGTWPPNPAAIIAAGIHFDSAAEYGILAGKHTARPSASAGGYGAGGGYGADAGRGEEYGGGRIGAGQQDVAGNWLAPGAQGLNGGRLNVIIIGESEQARFFADRVNEADKAGHFMTVSAARRSAPAQG